MFADLENMNTRTEAIILIFVNAAAAAAAFVGAILLTARLNYVPGFAGLFIGLVGLGYFVKQAEAQRAKLRRR